MALEPVVYASLGVLVLALFAVAVPPDLARASALVVTVGLLMVTGNNSVPRVPRVASFAFCAVVLLVGLLRGRGAAGASRATTFWPVLLLWSGLAVGVLVDRSYPAQSAALYFGTAALVALVASRLSARETRVVLGAFLVMACLESLWGLAEVATSSTPMWGFRGGYVRTNPLTNDLWHRAQASTGQPIVLGTVAGIGALVAWTDRIGLGTRMRVVALAVTGMGIFVSGTRSVALCLAIAVLTHLLARPNLLRWFRNVAAVGVVVGVVAVFNFGLSKLTTDLLASGSWVHRLTSLEGVPNLLARPLPVMLFGSGFGSQRSLFEDGYIQNTYGLQVVDDFLVYLLGTSGLIGLIVFLLLTGLAAVRSNAQGRVIILFMVGMSLSFDLLVWFFMGIVLSLFYALPSDRPTARRKARTSFIAPLAPAIPRDQRLA